VQCKTRKDRSFNIAVTGSAEIGEMDDMTVTKSGRQMVDIGSMGEDQLLCSPAAT